MSHQVLVNLSAKEPDPWIKYHSFDPIVIQNHKNENDQEQLNFHIPILIKEVKKLPRKTIKQYKKNLQTFIATATGFLVLPLKSMAAPLTVTTSGTRLPSQADGIPPEIFHLILQLLITAVGIVVVLAAILLMGAGVKRMFGQRKDANEWTTDIIKGLLQALVAVPVVFLLYYIVNLLFAGSGWFVSPF